MDNGAFSSLKAHWRKECQYFYSGNLGKVINSQNFMAVFAKAWVKGMAITNVVSCFKSVGVYPLDRRVAVTPIAQESEIFHQNTPTPFVPFCTPQKGVANATPPSTPPTDATTQPATFTAAEVEHFQACLQESEDSRYVLWLQTFYPKQNATQGHGIMEAYICSRPTPPAQQRAPNYPQSACVLTSEQSIMALEEKAEEKKRKQEGKEKRMRKREMKRQEMAAQKEAAKKTKGKQVVLDTTNLLSFARTVNRHHVITCALRIPSL